MEEGASKKRRRREKDRFSGIWEDLRAPLKNSWAAGSRAAGSGMGGSGRAGRRCREGAEVWVYLCAGVYMRVWAYACTVYGVRVYGGMDVRLYGCMDGLAGW